MYLIKQDAKKRFRFFLKIDVRVFRLSLKVVGAAGIEPATSRSPFVKELMSETLASLVFYIRALFHRASPHIKRFANIKTKTPIKKCLIQASFDYSIFKRMWTCKCEIRTNYITNYQDSREDFAKQNIRGKRRSRPKAPAVCTKCRRQIKSLAPTWFGGGRN